MFSEWVPIIISTCLWTAAYFLLRKFTKNRDPEFTNRLITLAHGTVICFLAIPECVRYGWVFNRFHIPTTKRQVNILLYSSGYFIFDTLWCLYYQTETKLMIGHHIYSVFAITRSLRKPENAAHAVCTLGSLEITNPLLQARWFLRTLGYHKTNYYVAVECTFIALFIMVRLLLASVVVFKLLINYNKYDWEFLTLAIVIYIVSWGFIIGVIKYFIKKYGCQSSTSREAFI